MKRKMLAAAVAVALGLGVLTSTTQAYVEVPYALGRLVQESTNIVLMKVEKVDAERNLVIYRKVKDLKGVHPSDVIKHNIGKAGFHPREWQITMATLAPGKMALFMHNGAASETCIDNYWYQAYPGDWWAMSHAEPFLLRSFAGKPEKLADLVTQMLQGKEVVTTCMVDGDKNAIQLRTAKLQRMKASLKIQDYDPKRDFLGFGGDDFRKLAGNPGFAAYGAMARTDPGAWGVVKADVNGDGQEDLCTFGEDRVALLLSAGNLMEEAALPLTGGARSACFGDYNGDGKLDLLLATPTGPKLFANAGSGSFTDVSAALPQERYYNLTSAQFIDADADGKLDVLLANGFCGLRLYRNTASSAAAAATPPKPKIGPWQYIGPFDNADGVAGFSTVYPPEQEQDLKKTYKGKGSAQVAWKEGKFPDGQVNSFLPLFPKPEQQAGSVVYLYREIDLGGAAELPVSLGSDDGLAVWLNGEKIVSDNAARAAGPDQALVTLKLKPGVNKLLMKVTQGNGEWGFYFAPKATPTAVLPKQFEDVSDSIGLGLAGVGSTVKGDRILVADFNKDGRTDFLYCAGTGVLAMNTPKGFVESKAAGLSFKAGNRIAPAAGDFDGDGLVDLAIPQPDGVRLFKNTGGQFTDVSAQSPDLAIPGATSVLFSDFNATGKQDLLVGVMKAPNRYLKNNGNGTFADASEAVGLAGKIYNTRGLAVFDMNKDGVPDLALNNEGSEPCILIGNLARTAKK
jgi:hypothetical protein